MKSTHNKSITKNPLRSPLTTFVFIFFLISTNLFAQVKNSNKNTILEFYNGEYKILDVSGGVTSIEYSTEPTAIFVRNDDGKKINIKKEEAPQNTTNPNIHYISFKFGFTGIDKFTDLDKFDYKSKLGILGGIYYRKSFNEVNINKNGKSKNRTTYKLGADFQFDKLKVYNPEKGYYRTESPITLNLNAGLNYYLLNICKKFTFGIALNGKWNIITSNKDRLYNYSNLSDGSIINDEIFIVESFEGKYGILNEKERSGSLSLALPIIPNYQNFFFVVVPTPHLSYETFSYSKPKFTSGIVLNFLNKNVFTKDEEKPKTKNYKTPSLISIGVDWSNIDNSWSKPNWFLTGSLSFKPTKK